MSTANTKKGWKMVILPITNTPTEKPSDVSIRLKRIRKYKKENKVDSFLKRFIAVKYVGENK